MGARTRKCKGFPYNRVTTWRLRGWAFLNILSLIILVVHSVRFHAGMVALAQAHSTLWTIIAIKYMVEDAEKPVRWIGASYDELMSFPAAVHREAGHDLGRVQSGLLPKDWKPMESVGPGVYEIRVSIREAGGKAQYRVLYVAKFEEAVYVLRVFQKTTRKTSLHDLQVARARYREMLRQRQELRKRPTRS